MHRVEEAQLRRMPCLSEKVIGKSHCVLQLHQLIMKSNLSHGFNHNLRTFVVLLHNYALIGEKDPATLLGECKQAIVTVSGSTYS